MQRKKRTSLDTIMTQVVDAASPPAAPATSPTAPLQVEAPTADDPGPGIIKQTAYLKAPVYEQLRRLGFEERRKMHFYLMEGLDRVFRARGLPSIEELEKEAK